MILRRFYNDMLAQASYLVGCSATKEAAVIDPNRSTQEYIDAARQEGLKITAVTETHIHADFVSGAWELAGRTGATLYLSGEAQGNGGYDVPALEKVHLVKSGESVRIGNVRLDVLHTPGHTPEHISFLLIDEPASDIPLGMFSGDFLFVGDVGRPDLLDLVGGRQGTMQAAARQLFQSVQKLRQWPDSLLVFPGHGSGSACGKSLGGVPVSSLGYERHANWALRETSLASFVEHVLDHQPEPPPYFAEMKRLNKARIPPLHGRALEERDAASLLSQPSQGIWMIDIRPAAAFAAAHVRSSVSIPLGRNFLNWVGTVLPAGSEILLISANRGDAEAACSALPLIGYDSAVGWIDATELLRTNLVPLESLPEVSPEFVVVELAGGSLLLDVRSEAEHAAGHIDGAVHMPLGMLLGRAASLPKNGRVVVHCQSGGRSPIAVSLLQRMGFVDVANLRGGFSAFQTAEVTAAA